MSREREKTVWDLARLLAGQGVELQCLRLSRKGHPWHPLYLPADAKLKPFTMRVPAGAEG